MAEGRGLRAAFSYVVGLAILAGAGFVVWHIWQRNDAALIATREALAAEVARGPRVQVVPVTAGPTERLITLLADTRPYQTATLYSKVGGYLKSIGVDRGDHVITGQILAEVDSPETDRQYDAAVNDMENKRRNAARAHELMAHGSVSVQAAEQADTEFRVAVENVAQLATMRSYELLRAPFTGTVTARFVDPGALIQNSTTNQTSNQPVVTVSDESRLRVSIYVEQRDVPFVHVGDMADVADAANAERKVKARIARTANVLDPRTRTLFVELEVDNHDHFLLPGSFAYVTLHMPLPSYPEVPVAGLVMRGSNTFVAHVGKDDLVRLRPVKVVRTDGVRVSLGEGATVGDRVAINLPDEVGDGGRVQPVAMGR